MQNLGSVEASTPIQEIQMDIANVEKTSLFISSTFNGKIKGYLAASNNRDICVYNLDGNVKKIIFF